MHGQQSQLQQVRARALAHSIQGLARGPGLLLALALVWAAAATVAVAVVVVAAAGVVGVVWVWAGVGVVALGLLLVCCSRCSRCSCCSSPSKGQAQAHPANDPPPTGQRLNHPRPQQPSPQPSNESPDAAVVLGKFSHKSASQGWRDASLCRKQGRARAVD